jgi:hypothetical protein
MDYGSIMRTFFGHGQRLLTVSIISLAVIVGATKVDGRLATVRKAFIVPVDELGDDMGVATCLANHLKTLTPIEAVKTKEEADVVFKVSSHLRARRRRFSSE